MNDEAGLSSLGLPTGLGGAEGGQAAMAAASTLSRSATLWAGWGSWWVRSSPGCLSPSEHFHFEQPTSKSVLCPFGAWGSRGGEPGRAVAKLPYLASSLKSYLFTPGKLRERAGIN